jgi:thymidylate synthase (FAD)
MNPVEAKVTLVRMTPDPDAAIAIGAKLCYASHTDRILQQDKEQSERLVGQLIQMGHLSPVEHASFTFLVEGVSRCMTHQLVRHRIASYSQRSQRYVAHDSFDYIIPPQFEGRTVELDGRAMDAVEYFRETMEVIAQRYARLNDAVGRQGESSNEDARYVLPNACETKILVTMNARELLHFFEERLCLRAQWEIRGVAEQMLALLKQACPVVFNRAGPKCIEQGRCPEGAKSCGNYAEIKKRYSQDH